MPTLDNINELLIKGEIEKPLEMLREWAKIKFPEQEQEIIHLQARCGALKKDYHAGVLTFENYQIERTKIVRSALILKNELIENLQYKESKGKAIPIFHAYTCDRVEATDMFDQHRKTLTSASIRFFCIYGGEFQRHQSFVERLRYELEGRIQQLYDANLTSSCTVLPVVFDMEPSNDMQNYRERFLRNLFAACGLPPNNHGPLLDKDLSYLVDNSVKLKNLKSDDFAFVLVKVNHWDWDPTLTPAALEWFVTKFCEKPLKEGTPSILFFFAVSLDGFNEDSRTDIVIAIQNSKYLTILPELGMVLKRDVGSWLSRHNFVIPDTKHRNELLITKFSNQSGHTMEEVEEILQDIIEKYNRKLIR